MKRLYILFGVFVLVLAMFTALSAERIVKTQRGVEYEDLIVGDGMRAVPGKIATIHLVMWSDNNGEKGNQIYNSYKDNEHPICFKIGTKKISDGLNIGVAGMKVGGKRRLHVPSELNPKIESGPFPANANLIFEVELLNVQ